MSIRVCRFRFSPSSWRPIPKAISTINESREFINKSTDVTCACIDNISFRHPALTRAPSDAWTRRWIVGSRRFTRFEPSCSVAPCLASFGLIQSPPMARGRVPISKLTPHLNPLPSEGRGRRKAALRVERPTWPFSAATCRRVRAGNGFYPTMHCQTRTLGRLVACPNGPVARSTQSQHPDQSTNQPIVNHSPKHSAGPPSPKPYRNALERLQLALRQNTQADQDAAVDRIRRELFGPIIDQIKEPAWVLDQP